MRLSKKVLTLFLSAVLLVTSLTGCGGSKKTEKAAAEPTLPAATEEILSARSVREGIQTVMAVSLSDRDLADSAGGFRNANQADMLMLLIIDESRGRTTALQVNPDTVVPFTAPGTSDAVEIPLGEIYSYGSGGSDSCLNLQKAVSKLLGGIKIDHYMIFAQGALGIANDTLGGLEVDVPADLAEAYPEFTQEEPVRLAGEQANVFFSFRAVDDVTNQFHMARQQQFIAALYGPFTKSMQQDDFLTKLTMKLGDRLDTDLALSQMVQLMEVMESCQLDETIETLPGEAKQEDGQYRYRVNADGVNRLVERLFY